MVYAETIRASAKIWYSEEMGGSGIGYQYRMSNISKKSNGITKPDNDIINDGNNFDIEIREVPGWVRADGRGAGYGMVVLSFSAFFGPVGAAGLAYGAITGAVTSSFLPMEKTIDKDLKDVDFDSDEKNEIQILE